MEIAWYLEAPRHLMSKGLEGVAERIGGPWSTERVATDGALRRMAAFLGAFTTLVHCSMPRHYPFPGALYPCIKVRWERSDAVTTPLPSALSQTLTP